MTELLIAFRCEVQLRFSWIRYDINNIRPDDAWMRIFKDPTGFMIHRLCLKMVFMKPTMAFR